MIRTFFLAGMACGAVLFAGCAAPVAGPVAEPVAEPGFQRIVTEASGKVFPAVVYIQVVTDDLSSGKARNTVVSGSGVLISPDGEVLSNWHVIDKARSIRCQLNNGEAFTARLIGADKDVDLALLKLVRPEGAPPLAFARIDADDRLAEGDFVMAMGAPWGLNRSVSIGIISCASRYLPESTYSLWYQTDASISPGNSGGPLVNTSGDIVGINTLGFLFGGTVAFAVPAPTIRDILPRLRAYGKLNWAWFGFLLQPLRDFERDINFDFPDGVIVSGTEPGSPARKAGFLPNDRIIAIGGNPVTVGTNESMPGVRRMLGLMPFGVKVPFTVVRGGETLRIEVAPVEKGAVEGGEISCPRWGLTAKEINRFDTPNLHYFRNSGVYIFGVSDFGNAMEARLYPNDIVVSVDGTPVSTLEELKTVYDAAMKRVDTDPRTTFTVLRNGRMLQRVMNFSNDYDKE